MMPFVALALWFLVIAIAIGFSYDVPVVDDWTYAWTVEHLLSTGTFSVLDWSSAYPIAQAIWGAAWSALLGFSFNTLSLSTLVLGAVGCGALYALIRELGASKRIAFIGALCLAVNPLYVFLSASFMTDVPFITFSTLTLLCYVLAVTRRQARYLWWAAVWAFAAFLTRQVGIALPVAGLPLLLMPLAGSTVSSEARWPLRRWHVLLSLITTWVVMAITLAVLREQLGVTSVMQRWASNVYAGQVEYYLLVPYFFALISFYLLPALLADASIRGVWRRPKLLAGIFAVATLLLLVVHGAIPVPLRHDQTWSLQELGASRALINGELPERMPLWLELPARGAAMLTLTLLVAVIVGRGQWRARLTAWAHAPERFLPRASIVTFIVAYLVLVNLLWMYSDRYYLVLVPPLVALILGGHAAHPAPPVGRLRLAASALVMFALIALVGTRDAQRFNQEVRDTSQALLDAGVPPFEIDAGYAWNGWMLYAHPSNLAPGMTTWDVPWIWSLRQSKYIISNTADVKGYRVQRKVSWWGLPWPGRNELYVLEHERGSDTAASINAATPDTQ